MSVLVINPVTHPVPVYSTSQQPTPPTTQGFASVVTPIPQPVQSPIDGVTTTLFSSLNPPDSTPYAVILSQSLPFYIMTYGSEAPCRARVNIRLHSSAAAGSGVFAVICGIMPTTGSVATPPNASDIKVTDTPPGFKKPDGGSFTRVAVMRSAPVVFTTTRELDEVIYMPSTENPLAECALVIIFCYTSAGAAGSVRVDVELNCEPLRLNYA